MHRLHASTVPFYMRNLSIHGFGYPQGEGEGRVLELILSDDFLDPCSLSYKSFLPSTLFCHSPNVDCPLHEVLKFVSPNLSF